MIVLGADTHKRSHTIAAIAAGTGELLGERTVPATGEQHALARAGACRRRTITPRAPCWTARASSRMKNGSDVGSQAPRPRPLRAPAHGSGDRDVERLWTWIGRPR
jgi:hypothetical protein